MPRKSCIEVQQGHHACDSSQSLPICFKMAWPGLLKVPHLLPHKGLGHLRLYKARRTGSTLKEKISALSWNHISDAPERRQVFMSSKALNLLPSKGPCRYFSWDRHQEVCCPAQSRVTCDTRPCYSSLCPGSSWKPPATEPTQPVWWCLPLPACPHGQQIALYALSDSPFIFQLCHPARHWWERMAPSPPSLSCPYRQLDIASSPRLCPSASSQFLQIFIG